MCEDRPAERRTAVLHALQMWRVDHTVELTDELASALDDSDASVRHVGAEAAGWAAGCGRPLVAKLIRALGADEEPFCRESAAFALGEIGGPEAVAALVEAAGREASPLVREAIVAALGAIGSAAAAPIVIGMTRGEKPAVRRRAVVACAAFDSPAADEAIRSALGDRDRYVREAAEWVLRAPT